VNVLQGIGSGVIHRLAYAGQLTIQFWSGLLAVPRVLPVVGSRGRWGAAVRQMAAIGVDDTALGDASTPACARMIVWVVGFDQDVFHQFSFVLQVGLAGRELIHVEHVGQNIGFGRAAYLSWIV